MRLSDRLKLARFRSRLCTPGILIYKVKGFAAADIPCLLFGTHEAALQWVPDNSEMRCCMDSDHQR
jgi:hypothetical protein